MSEAEVIVACNALITIACCLCVYLIVKSEV